MPATIETVLGPLAVDQLGVTHPHEHLSMDFSTMGQPPPPGQNGMEDCPFDMEHLGWIRHYPFSHKFNLILNDDASRRAVLEDVKAFKDNGGQTIVENTTIGLHRDLSFLKHVAQETGVNVIAGAGFYIAKVQPSNVLQYSVEEIANIIRSELTTGTDGIKCGVIGEIASVYPVEPFEKRVLQASAIVQQELRSPVIVHPHRVVEAPYEIVRIFQEAGGKVDKMVMSHLDRTFFSVEELLEFSKLGTYLEFDMFGIDCSHYQLNDKVDMPNDGQRIQWLKGLVEEGLEDRIVLAHDIYAKHRLRKFGGHGYSHILLNVIPKMLNRGFTQEQVDKFLVLNPRKWLSP